MANISFTSHAFFYNEFIFLSDSITSALRKAILSFLCHEGEAFTLIIDYKVSSTNNICQKEKQQNQLPDTTRSHTTAISNMQLS